LLEDSFARVMLDGIAKKVYASGNGPALIVMAAMPGIQPARCALRPRNPRWRLYSSYALLVRSHGAVPTAKEAAAVFGTCASVPSVGPLLVINRVPSHRVSGRRWKSWLPASRIGRRISIVETTADNGASSKYVLEPCRLTMATTATIYIAIPKLSKTRPSIG